MKFVIYNLLFACVFPFLLPGFLLRMFRRGGYRARMLDRFALYPREIVSQVLAERGRKERVWVHAVSVGEVQVAGQLMREWRRVDPAVSFIFSTTSSTGWQMAAREISADDLLIYNPLDFPNFVKSALKLFRPKAVILTESEIWPIFIRTANKMKIPLFLINARVSDRSAPRYAFGRFFFKDVFACFSRIFAQSAMDRSRLLAAGAPENRVDVSGSFKFDVAKRNPEKENELRAWIGPGEILLGGSTWPGEDQILLSAYREIFAKTHSPNAPILVIAPRHFEKADAVEENIRAAGFVCVRRRRGDTREKVKAGERAVFLADTTGELMGLYGISRVAFVGKSLTAHGSQNMIEPCLCGVATLVGPNTENFRPVMSDLLAANAIRQIRDAAELTRAIREIFATGDDGLGARGRNAVAKRCGVVARCVKEIREKMS